MGKDPAFLFYSADFFMDTADLTAAQVGHYIRLLCFQHQKGRLSEAFIRNITRDDMDETLLSKFIRDENDLYYNEVFDAEIKRRAEYTQSRRRNRQKADTGPAREQTHAHDMKNICSTYDEHMETETETETETGTKTGIDDGAMPDADAAAISRPPRHSRLAARFDALWEGYPRKQGRALAFKAYQRAVKEGTADEEIREGISNYLDSIEHLGIEARYVKQGGTFFSQQSWADDYGQAQEPETRYAPPFID